MVKLDEKKFLKPEKKYRTNIIVHNWPEDRTLMMDAVNAYGYAGVVTQPPLAKFSAKTFGGTVKEKRFFADPENVAVFKDIMAELKERDLSYWLYDEEGYPSGYASGKTLEGHPEFEAKGFYMRRRAAYEPTHVNFHLDDWSDKIVFAAKYPIVRTANTPRVPGNASTVLYDQMTPVPFTETSVVCDLAPKEVLFIFCVKSAYEGSQCTHNTCSFDRQINLLNPDAVRRFLELVYEPIASGAPGSFENATAVFTDEPSLMTCYTRENEAWDYALMPWVEGIFDAFEKEYGYSLLTYLPLLFEGGERAYSVRTQFYRLVGKLVARSYAGQISDFCRAHGTRFGGHYLGEEFLDWHTRFYGSYLEVIKRVDYVGIDMLRCYPERYTRNSVKYAMMAVRKNGMTDLMVEFCPFSRKETFYKDPFNNALGTLSLLYLGGAREVNNYYYSDFLQYPPLVEANAKRGVVNAPDPARMTQEQAMYFNDYVGRLRYMLDGLLNETETLVYYPIEDAQSTCQPFCSYPGEGLHPIDIAIKTLTYAISDAGHDYNFADDDDIILAAENATLYGTPVKTVLIPACTAIYDHTLAALKKLEAKGVRVMFVDASPAFAISLDCAEVVELEELDGVSVAEVVSYLDEADARFTAKAEGAVLQKARYTKEGHELYFICNSTRDVPADALLMHSEKTEATVYDPTDGSTHRIRMGEHYTVPAFRGVFILFD